MHAIVALLLSLTRPLLAQQPPPRFLYIYRDSLKQGVDSIYRVIEDEAARICADLRCPNPYLALESLGGTHEAWWEGFAAYRPDLSGGPAWSAAGARFVLVTITRSYRRAEGSVWETKDSTLYVLRPVRTRQEAESLAAAHGARMFAVRPNWSMPAPEWVTADPDFWRRAPAPRASR